MCGYLILREFSSSALSFWAYCHGLLTLTCLITFRLMISSLAIPFRSSGWCTSAIITKAHSKLSGNILTSLEGIKQFYVNVDKEEWKLDLHTVCVLYETIAILRVSTIQC